MVHADPAPVARRDRPAGRPRPGLGVARRAAAAERGGRGADAAGRRRASAGCGRCSAPTPPARRGRRAARRAVRAGPGAARARPGRRRRGDHRRRPAHGAARGRRHPGRGAARPPAAGAARRRHRRAARRGRARPARRAHDGRAASTTCPSWPPPSATRARSTGRRRARPSRRYAGSSCCSTCGAPSRRRRCAAAASACATCGRPPPRCTSTSRPRPCSSRSPRPPGCSRPPPTPTATRSGCRPTWSTTWVAAAARRALGRRWPAPGWTARGCPGWSARATRPARRGTRSRPSWPASTWPRPGAMTLAGAGRRCPAAVLATGTGVPSLVARLRWQRPRRPRTRADQVAVDGRPRPPSLGLTGLDGARVVRPRRCWPATTTTAAEGAGRAAARAGRPRAAAGRPHRGRARPAGVAAGPAAAAGRRRRVARRGDRLPVHAGSVRRALDTGWTAVELHEFLGSVSRTPVPAAADLPGRRHRPHLRLGAGRPRRGVPARRRRGRARPSCCTTRRRRRSGCAGWRRRCWSARLPLDLLLPRLRELGAAPVVEAADGTVHVVRPDQRRARTPREHRGARSRRGPAYGHASPPSSPRSAPATGPRRPARPGPRRRSRPSRLAGRAARGGREPATPVLIGYVDNHGTSSERVVDPVSRRGRRAHRARPPQPTTSAPSPSTGSRRSDPFRAEPVDLNRGLHPVRRARRPALLNADDHRRRRRCARTSPTATWLVRPVHRPRLHAAAEVPARAAAGLRGVGAPTTPPAWSTGSTS